MSASRPLLSLVLGLAVSVGGTVPSGQRDQGLDADGTVPQPGPYRVPPEASGALVGGPQGAVSQPALFTSAIYPSRKFRYSVYVPASYRDGQPAALMVFQDGLRTYVDLLKTPWVFDHLIHAGQLPITIAVFVDPGTPDGAPPAPNTPEWAMRSVQYDSVDDTYTRFLLDELLPEVVLQRYTITTDPDGWAIGGQSSGGIAAFTVAWNRPDRFRKVLTQNGSFVNIRGGHVYPSFVVSDPAKPLRVYLLSSTNDLNSSYGNWLQGNTALAAALQTRSYAYRFRKGTGEHYPPRQALADYPDALRWLWNGYVLPH